MVNSFRVTRALFFCKQSTAYPTYISSEETLQKVLIGGVILSCTHYRTCQFVKLPRINRYITSKVMVTLKTIHFKSKMLLFIHRMTSLRIYILLSFVFQEKPKSKFTSFQLYFLSGFQEDLLP